MNDVKAHKRKAGTTFCAFSSMNVSSSSSYLIAAPGVAVVGGRGGVRETGKITVRLKAPICCQVKGSNFGELLSDCVSGSTELSQSDVPSY